MFAERWELYLGGIEIANAYSELTDLVEQKKRFSEAESQRSLEGAKKYETPYSFYNALEYGMPESAGCALGVDRLLMLFANLQHINDVKCL
jgi:lysyl-tRNA synthetase class 2